MSPAAAADARDLHGSVAHLERVGLSYGKTRALDDINLDLPSGGMIGASSARSSMLLTSMH